MGSGLDDYPRQDAHQLSKQHVDLISWLYFFADNLHLVSKHLGNKKGEKYYHQLKTFYNETLHKHYLDNSDHLFKDISVSDNHNINGFVTHLGYINLFPFMMGMVHEGGEIFKKIVEIMTDEDILWSQSGLRSLSKSDRLYGTLDNYWRGAVWMPINYMVLRACKLYYPNSTGDLYKRLKANLVKTVEGNRDSTGYLYENYH
jgi:mannosyl-oligosaccharide glucosidase